MSKALFFWGSQEEKCYAETQTGKSRSQQTRARAHRWSGARLEARAWPPSESGHLGLLASS